MTSVLLWYGGAAVRYMLSPKSVSSDARMYVYTRLPYIYQHESWRQGPHHTHAQTKLTRTETLPSLSAPQSATPPQQGTPYLGSTDGAFLIGELSSLRREKHALLDKDVRLQQRANLILMNEGKEADNAGKGNC